MLKLKILKNAHNAVFLKNIQKEPKIQPLLKDCGQATLPIAVKLGIRPKKAKSSAVTQRRISSFNTIVSYVIRSLIPSFAAIVLVVSPLSLSKS